MQSTTPSSKQTPGRNKSNASRQLTPTKFSTPVHRQSTPLLNKKQQRTTEANGAIKFCRHLCLAKNLCKHKCCKRGMFDLNGDPYTDDSVTELTEEESDEESGTTVKPQPQFMSIDARYNSVTPNRPVKIVKNLTQERTLQQTVPSEKLSPFPETEPPVHNLSNIFQSAPNNNPRYLDQFYEARDAIISDKSNELADKSNDLADTSSDLADTSNDLADTPNQFQRDGTHHNGPQDTVMPVPNEFQRGTNFLNQTQVFEDDPQDAMYTVPHEFSRDVTTLRDELSNNSNEFQRDGTHHDGPQDTVMSVPNEFRFQTQIYDDSQPISPYAGSISEASDGRTNQQSPSSVSRYQINNKFKYPPSPISELSPQIEFIEIEKKKAIPISIINYPSPNMKRKILENAEEDERDMKRKKPVLPSRVLPYNNPGAPHHQPEERNSSDQILKSANFMSVMAVLVIVGYYYNPYH